MMADRRLVLRKSWRDVAHAQWFRLLCQQVEDGQPGRVPERFQAIGQTDRLRLRHTWLAHVLATGVRALAQRQEPIEGGRIHTQRLARGIDVRQLVAVLRGMLL